MGLIINDKDKCYCGAYWQENGYCVNGHLNSKEKTNSKEALKVLNEKEKQLKENIMKLIIKSKADDKSVVRVLAFLINSFKKLGGKANV